MSNAYTASVDYAKLAQILRNISSFPCGKCNCEDYCDDYNLGCIFRTAAEAIEELSEKYQMALEELVKQAGPPKGGKNHEYLSCYHNDGACDYTGYPRNSERYAAQAAAEAF